MRFEFTLSHGEFAKAWLAEYYLATKWGPLRLLGGPFLGLLGWQLRTLRPRTYLAAFGAFTIGYGIYYALKPLLQVGLLVRRRHKLGAQRTTTVVHVDDDGIRITCGSASSSIGWDRVARAGKRPGYVWFEISETTRGTIPLAAIDDLPALEGLFRDQDKWS